MESIEAGAMDTTVAIPPPPLFFQLAAAFADDLVFALGVRQGDASSWVLFSVGIRRFADEAPEDVA